MDEEEIANFLSLLEELVSKAQVIQSLVEEGNTNMSSNNLEAFSEKLEEHLTSLRELQDILEDALGLEVDAMPLDFDDADEIY